MGRKRKRREVEPEPNLNIIGNLHDIEESKDEPHSEAQSDVPPKRSARQKSKSPPKKGGKRSQSKMANTPRSKSPMELRRRINAGEMTGSAEITNKAAKLSLKESKLVKIGQFKTAPEE